MVASVIGSEATSSKRTLGAVFTRPFMLHASSLLVWCSGAVFRSLEVRALLWVSAGGESNRPCRDSEQKKSLLQGVCRPRSETLKSRKRASARLVSLQSRRCSFQVSRADGKKRRRVAPGSVVSKFHSCRHKASGPNFLSANGRVVPYGRRACTDGFWISGREQAIRPGSPRCT